MKPTFMLCLLALALAGGCRSKPSEMSDLVGQTAIGELDLTMSVDKTIVQPGDTLKLELKARNTGDEPIPVNATSGAKIIVTIWRYSNGWHKVKQYPQATVQVYSPWVLPADEMQTFYMDVPVEPDWPQVEMIKLTAELNGRPEGRPFVLLRVMPKHGS